MVNHEGRKLLDIIQDVIRDTVAASENYTNFFNNYEKMNDTFTKEQLSQYKDELTFLRQYLSYLVGLQEELENSENSIDSAHMRYSKEIDELKNLLGNKSSAPKEQVYPKFAAVSQSYLQLLDEKNNSNIRLELFKLLQTLRSEFELTLSEKHIEEAQTIASYQKEPEINHDEINIDPNGGVSRLLPHTTPDFLQTPLDYLGYCIWSLVKKDGLLVPGKPSFGVYRYKDKHCVFSSAEAIKEFIEDPAFFIEGVNQQCRKNPELIHLLRLEDAFKHVSILTLLESREGGPGLSTKLMVDKSCETPVHFIEKNLDPNYYWNEWDLRRKAIQMANIRNKQTKACQTILSNFKVDSETQVWLKKDASTNTGINKGTDPIKPKNYMVGLRTKQT